MDLYELALAYLFKLKIIQQWPDIQPILKRILDRKEHHWMLSVIACQAVGGNPELVYVGIIAIACVHTSILLIDDMLDKDPRGEYTRIGEPAAANLSAALQAISVEVLAECDLPPATQLAAARSINHTALQIAHGQGLDVQNPETEHEYWEVVKLKSSPFFGGVLEVGALLGGASLEVTEQLRQWGSLYGEAIQIHDDLNDAFEIPANPDWTEGRTPLPILFAQSVDHPDQARFLELRAALQSAPQPELLKEAQTILLKSGAVSYGLNELFARHRQLSEMLMEMELPNRDVLARVLDNLINPANRLLEQLNKS